MEFVVLKSVLIFFGAVLAAAVSAAANAPDPACISKCGDGLQGCESAIRQRIDECTEPLERACDYMPGGVVDACKRDARTYCEAEHADEHDACLSENKECTAACDALQ